MLQTSGDTNGQAAIYLECLDFRPEKEPVIGNEGCAWQAVAILNRNQVAAYLVPARTYEAMLDRLDDVALVEIAKSRAGEQGIPIDLGRL